MLRTIGLLFGGLLCFEFSLSFLEFFELLLSFLSFGFHTVVTTKLFDVFNGVDNTVINDVGTNASGEVTDVGGGIDDFGTDGLEDVHGVILSCRRV